MLSVSIVSTVWQNHLDGKSSFCQLKSRLSKLSSEDSRAMEAVGKISAIFQMLEVFWSRVPDRIEMEHRRIAQSRIVVENGQEMMNAEQHAAEEEAARKK